MGNEAEMPQIRQAAEAVAERARELNAAVRAAADVGLTVRLEVRDNHGPQDPEAVPAIKVRVDRRIL